MNPLISIIVPVYNVEEYLDKCVDSIINQTYTNLEIILVDDGSPDNCPAMCDEWAEKDNRIKVIHKENGGLSDARNSGIEASNGKWVYFIDSDDYVSEDTIEKLYKVAIVNNCDMAIGRYVEVCDGIEKEAEYSNQIYIYSQDEYWEQLYSLSLQKEYLVSVSLIISCNKLIKRNIFDSIKFLEGKYHEDEFIIHNLISKCNKIAFLDSKLYYYVQQNNSIMHKPSLASITDGLEAVVQRENYFIENKKTFLNLSLISSLENIMGYCFKFKYVYKNKELTKKSKKLYRYYYKIAIKNNVKKEEYYKKDKLLFFSFYINEYLYRLVRKIKRMTRNL